MTMGSVIEMPDKLLRTLLKASGLSSGTVACPLFKLAGTSVWISHCEAYLPFLKRLQEQRPTVATPTPMAREQEEKESFILRTIINITEKARNFP